MKMKILHVELAMKEKERNMKQQQYRCSTETSTSSASRNLNLWNKTFVHHQWTSNCCLQSSEVTLLWEVPQSKSISVRQSIPVIVWLNHGKIWFIPMFHLRIWAAMLFEVIVKHCCCNYDNTASSWFKAQCVSETLETTLPYTKHALHCTSGMDMSLVVPLLLRCDCMKVRVNKKLVCAYPLSPSMIPLCWPPSNWAYRQEFWNILESWVAPFQHATMLENCIVGVHTHIYWEPVFMISVLLRICSRGTLY